MAQGRIYRSGGKRPRCGGSPSTPRILRGAGPVTSLAVYNWQESRLNTSLLMATFHFGEQPIRLLKDRQDSDAVDVIPRHC